MALDISGSRPAPTPAPQTSDADALLAAYRQTAALCTTLLKLSSLELPGVATSAYREAMVDAARHLERAQGVGQVRRAAAHIAQATQDHLRERDAALLTQEAEVESTMAILTEAVVEFTASGAVYTDQVLDSGQRLEALIGGSDLATLHTRLKEELLLLRTATQTKRRQEAAQVAQLRTEVAELEQRLSVAVRRGQRDGLTGLYNRAAWEERLLALPAQLAQGECYALVLIDVDYFKRINDERGHAAGDQALRTLAGLCQQAFGGDDFLARYGGDEVAVLVTAPSLAHAVDHGERLLASVRGANTQRRRAVDPAPFTLSIGLAQAQADEAVEALLARTDAALYAAKHAGRDRLMVAPPA